MRIGSYFGVPVYLHWTWLLFVGVIAVLSIEQIPVVFALYVIVTLHEFGHVLAGKQFGCRTSCVTLYPMGGIAAMEVQPVPRVEAAIALAGPAVNLVLAPLLWAVASPGLLSQISFCNLAILVFNLLPAFPMDGGRVVRALVTHTTGNLVKGTKVAVYTSYVMCALMLIAAISWGHFILAAVAILVYFSAKQELELRQSVVPPRVESADEMVQKSRQLLRDVQQQLDTISRKYR